MTFQHWAGVTAYTAPCGFARCCVFGKQSPELFRCGHTDCSVWQSLFRSYGRFIAEFLNAKLPVRLGLLDHPTGVGLRYGFVKLSIATVFLEAERFGLSPIAGSVRDQRSTQMGDLPPTLNALRFPRPVNADAPVFPLRHAASTTAPSFPSDMLPEGSRGQTGSQERPLGDLHEVQEY